MEGQRMACRITTGVDRCNCCCLTFVRQRRREILTRAIKAPDFSYLPAVDSHSCAVPNRLFVVADRKDPVHTIHLVLLALSFARIATFVCFVYSYRKGRFDKKGSETWQCLLSNEDVDVGILQCPRREMDLVSSINQIWTLLFFPPSGEKKGTDGSIPLVCCFPSPGPELLSA